MFPSWSAPSAPAESETDVFCPPGAHFQSGLNFDQQFPFRAPMFSGGSSGGPRSLDDPNEGTETVAIESSQARVRAISPEDIAHLDANQRIRVAEGIFDAADFFQVEFARRLREVVDAGTQVSELNNWVEQETAWFQDMRNLLSDGLGVFDKYLLNRYHASYIQVFLAPMLTIEYIRANGILASSKMIERSLHLKKVCEMYIQDKKGYRVSASRDELAWTFALGLLKHSIESRWEGSRLEMHIPISAKPLLPGDSAKEIAWPQDKEERALQSIQRVLRWTMNRSLAIDHVIFAIDFGEYFIGQ